MNDYQCAKDCPYRTQRPAVMESDLTEKTLFDLTELFKAVADPTRVRILWALHNAETCVCDIADRLSMTQSAVSHQLRVLKNARLVRFRREGKTVYYSLDDDHIFRLFESGMEHVLES